MNSRHKRGEKEIDELGGREWLSDKKADACLKGKREIGSLSLSTFFPFSQVNRLVSDPAGNWSSSPLLFQQQHQQLRSAFLPASGFP